jgi:hypothetical protein
MRAPRQQSAQPFGGVVRDLAKNSLISRRGGLDTAAVLRGLLKKQRYVLVAFFLLFAIPLFVLHLPLLGLPYFWDEEGQFIPTALDLLRQGAWVAHSTLPNVHPPGVEAFLVLWYKLFGYSIPVTRIAMLSLAACGLLLTFLLAIELDTDAEGAFWPPLLLLVSPLFFMQSFMAQLDMPAMVFTLCSLLLFLKKRFAASAAVCVLLVLAKETGIVTPLVFFVLLVWRREFRRAAWFIAPALALGIWLLILHRATGHWLGNPDFAHYNVGYSLHPVRLFMSFTRRIYYLFFAEFRFIGTLAILWATNAPPRSRFRTSNYKGRVAVLVAAANFIIVSVLGGAELERYLLPALPIFYIAVAIAVTALPKGLSALTISALLAGLAANLFWNPPYPFPYENNLAMVDFVRLQQTAGDYASRNLQNSVIATAWPYTTGLRNPDFGYVRQPLRTIETNDFNPSFIARLPKEKFDVLITYTRTWAPENGVIGIPAVRQFLARFYEWRPPITTEQCITLGLHPRISWSRRGQTLTIYVRKSASRVHDSPLMAEN